MTDHRSLEQRGLEQRGLDPAGTLAPTAAASPGVCVRVTCSPGAAGFADLVCADRDLLTAEFQAIIAANFPDETSDRTQGTDGPDPRRPSPPRAVSAARQRRPVPPQGADDSRGRALPARAAGRDVRPRQREPPPGERDTNASTKPR